MTFRKIIFCSHLLAGVTAGLVIFSMSFTGVVLMYEQQISDYLERSARWVAPSPDAKRLSYDELIAKIRAVSPKAHPAMITVKSDTRESVGVNLGRDNTVFINPYNGEILGGQSPTHHFLRDIVDRHRWLGVESEGRAAARALYTGEAFGFAGQTVAGLASLGGCFLVWTGLAMAWRRVRSWRREPEGFITAPILSKLTEGKISMPETSLDSLESIDAPLAQALSQAQLDLPHSAKRPHEHAYVAHDAALVEWSPASFNGDTLLILYGTVTGNAEMLANKVAAMVRRTGQAAQVRDMAYCQANTLKEATWVLVITSTYGDGEPPADAAPFWRTVVHGNALDLCGVKFSVLALGNTTFDHFCKCGRDLDMALQRHGATRFYPRVDCDADYDATAKSWITGVLASLELDNRDATSA